MSADKPVNRRSFFRESLRELLRPLAEAIDPVQRAAQQLGNLEPPEGRETQVELKHKASLPVWLRPPGAIEEEKFLATCQRSGQCVRVCPAKCIRIEADKGGGAPFIDVDTMPCVVCDGLLCMGNCPSQALLATPLVDIDMGTAQWLHESCLRTNGQDCTICVDRCPLGTAAIELRDGDIHVIANGCIGCGICQHDCPTNPKSIVVIPRSDQKFQI